MWNKTAVLNVFTPQDIYIPIHTPWCMCVAHKKLTWDLLNTSPAPFNSSVVRMLPIYLFLASYVVLSRVLPRVVRYWRATRRLQLSRRVVVFSRYPSAGRTKTRLIGTLGASGAAGLQLLMVSYATWPLNTDWLRFHYHIQPGSYTNACNDIANVGVCKYLQKDHANFL